MFISAKILIYYYRCLLFDTNHLFISFMTRFAFKILDSIECRCYNLLCYEFHVLNACTLFLQVKEQLTSFEVVPVVYVASELCYAASMKLDPIFSSFFLQMCVLDTQL